MAALYLSQEMYGVNDPLSLNILLDLADYNLKLIRLIEFSDYLEDILNILAKTIKLIVIDPSITESSFTFIDDLRVNERFLGLLKERMCPKTSARLLKEWITCKIQLKSKLMLGELYLIRA